MFIDDSHVSMTGAPFFCPFLPFLYHIMSVCDLDQVNHKMTFHSVLCHISFEVFTTKQKTWALEEAVLILQVVCPSDTDHVKHVRCAQLPRSPHNGSLEPHPLSRSSNLVLQLFVGPHQVAHHLSNPPDWGVSVEGHEAGSKVLWDSQRHEVWARVQAVYYGQLNHSGCLRLILRSCEKKEDTVSTAAFNGTDCPSILTTTQPPHVICCEQTCGSPICPQLALV